MPYPNPVAQFENHPRSLLNAAEVLKRRESKMQYIASLREQAAYYRELAAKQIAEKHAAEASEYQDLAKTCEEVAAELEEQMSAG